VIILILLTLAAAAVWAAGAYLFPFRHCRKCGGSGRKVRRLNHAHFDLCKRCGGTGRVQRPGSRLLHRAALTARAELARQRAARKTAGRTTLPDRPRP
jgi:hypothetical protein